MSDFNSFKNENNDINNGSVNGANKNPDAVAENIFNGNESTDINSGSAEEISGAMNTAGDGVAVNADNGPVIKSEYLSHTEHTAPASANGFGTPESPDDKVGSMDAHGNIGQTEEVAGTASNPYAAPNVNAANENYRADAYQPYNNMNTPSHEVNNAPQYTAVNEAQRMYTPCPRPVGESAGIRYDADKTSADGNYTWQYCQNGKPAVSESPTKKKRNVFKTLSLSLASLLVVGLVGFGIYWAVNYFGKTDNGEAGSSEAGSGILQDSHNKGNSDNDSVFPFAGANDGRNDPDTQTVVVTPDDDGILTKQMIAVKCKPSSVGIEVSAISHSYFGSYKTGGVGSGFILTENGYIATNNHVIAGAEEITVMLDDGTRHKAEIVGADSVTDLAVIKIEAEGLVPMEIGDSDLMRVGDSVIAIGTPAGIEFAGTVTDGIVSAVNRPVEVQGANGYTKTMTLMQTNAAINPGNSGGPLINNKGQVIGINTLKLTEEYEGIGFSIPINSAMTIFDQLIKDGKVTDYDKSFVTGTGAIGITNYFEVTEEESKYYGIPVGVMVIQLKPGSASQAAGLKRGDIITGFNGQKVTTVEEINKLKASFKAGDEVTLTVYRDPTEIVDITFKLDVMG